MLTNILIAAIVIIVFVVSVYLYSAFTCIFTKVTFIAAYTSDLRVTGSKKSALKAAMNVFVGRPPFNVLNSDEIDHLAELFSHSPDPTEIAEIFRRVDRKKDAQLLKNKDFLEELEKIALNSYAKD